ncbi:protein-disulfide isomerase [Novosphingobium sp. PhB165]|uniref:DsbA family protein n=1 Tax=Novosphingobium sp. PhB165 TaxID=2485105 RepID=UPI0010F3DC24|nr:thioredoxin domain-containing protein [Novosphingobium sp. PhB165]TCM17324.1 protein-disulfide isomerase [Novosphingobium sp. PhB165]
MKFSKSGIAARIGMLAAATLLATGAAPVHKAAAPAKPATKPAPRPAGPANWGTLVTVTADGSHMLGNPRAATQVVEFVSYTCPHCAHFTRDSDVPLRQTMVPKGQVAVTVTNLLRNPIDLTIAMLTTCGDPKRFFVRHNAFLATQDIWMAKLNTIGQDRQQAWYQGDIQTRMRAIAADFDFYSMVAPWGVSHAQADQCINDKAAFAKLEQQQKTVEAVGANSTPSFVLDGKLLDVHDWPGLSKALAAKQAGLRQGTV